MKSKYKVKLILLPNVSIHILLTFFYTFLGEETLLNNQ